MKIKKYNAICLFLLLFAVPVMSNEVVVSYELDGEVLEVSVSTQVTPVNYEGRFKQQSRFYFLRFKHKENFFSFNLPEISFEKLTDHQKEKLIRHITGLYDKSFKSFSEIFGYIPKGYKFSVTFGETISGISYDKIYLSSKTSNIFPNILPYRNGREVMTGFEEKIMLHEIGHSLFGITVGSLSHSKTKSIEEGFVDHMAGRDLLDGIDREGRDHRFEISAYQAENIKGLAQLDVDASVWGEKIALKRSEHKGYLGVTHHAFGLEFINAFINVFGKENLPEFLKRLGASEEEPSFDDLGTKLIQNIFIKMGYSDDKVSEFRNELHNRLKRNVFKINEKQRRSGAY